MPTCRTLLVLLCLAPLAGAHAQPRPRLLFDRAHGENEPTPPMVAAAERAGLDLATATTPITAAALAGVRVLYLRAPSTAIAPEERAGIVAFVRDGWRKSSPGWPAADGAAIYVRTVSSR